MPLFDAERHCFGHRPRAAEGYLFLRKRFYLFQPICIQDEPCQFHIEMRPNFLTECAQQRLVFTRTIWCPLRRQETDEIGNG
jgi:hypothetical protein